MNENDYYLSLGNVFNLIKSISISKNAALQIELFGLIFNVNDINKTTINNYCTGYRAISIIYKQRFIELKKQMSKDYLIFVDSILGFLRILDDKIYVVDDNSIDLINNNERLLELCQKLYLLSENDENVSNDFLVKIESLIKKKNLYECMIEYLYYAIIENKQPRYNIRYKVNEKEMKEYLIIKLYEGISYISSLKELSRKDNMYANAELGSLEFDGLISGSRDYEKSFDYYYKSALKNHPKGCWMVANLILTNRVNKDFNIAWEYLNKAIDLGSVAALNTIGNCYLNGLTPNKEKDLDKAIKYYLEASEYGYVFAFNNLGKIYEEKNPEVSLNYYKLSADLKESWALNKVGKYYLDNKDLETAFIYFEEAINCPLNERNYYAYFNLARYYYLKTDSKKALEYLTIAKNNGVKEADKLLNEIK